MDLASKNSRKKSHSSSKWLCSGSLPPQSPCLLDSFSKLVSALDTHFLRFTWFWDSRRRGYHRKEQYHRLTARVRSHLSHFFLRWKVTENSLRVRNGAQDGSVVTRESVHPSIWYQILLQPAGRSWKPAPHDESSPMNNSCSDQHSLMVFCSTQSYLLEESVLDQLLVGSHQEHSFN